MSVNSLTLLRALPVLMILALLVAPVVRAQAPETGVQSLAGIRTAAEKALRATIDASVPGVQLEAAALDARLRLAACPTRLEALASAPRHSQSRVPVRVSCAAPAWTVNVPVEIRRRTRY